MPVLYGKDIRALILEVIAAYDPNHLQQGPVLDDVRHKLNPNQNLAFHPNAAEGQIILTEWYELFRTGYLAWGSDLSNPNPPHFHLTAAGGAAMASRERDPINPAGYLEHVDNMAHIDDVCRSYLEDALKCFAADVSRASAVMLGAAAERLVLNIRDKIVARIERNHGQVSLHLQDWRVRTVMTGIETYMGANQGVMPHALREASDAQWPAFAQQIRAARNDAGHPQGLTPISRDTAHAGFLVFPELASVATKLGEALDA